MSRPDRSAATDALLAVAAEGDRTAFVRLYDVTAARVLALASALLGDHDRAEDLAQEVYAEAWREAASFDPASGSAESWLLDLARRRAGELAGADVGSPRAGLAALAPEQRDAVALACIGGLTHTEVDTVMGTPSGTAHRLLRDGLARLRDLLVTDDPRPLAG